MNSLTFAGALLRMYRLEKNWSQETLCRNICAVSYLSKIEQGKAQPNEVLLSELFAKLDVPWQTIPQADGQRICEELYDLVFSADVGEIERCKEEGLLRQEAISLGVNYLDYLVLRAYCCEDGGLIPESLRSVLDGRQKCLLLLLEDQPELAMESYPCPLSISSAGINAYTEGRETLAMELLQEAYDLASRNGYVQIMLNCQLFIANCHSNIGNIPSMLSHYAIAKRIARGLGDTGAIQSIEYNIASTQILSGDYRTAYSYFSGLTNAGVLELHKLAICCEFLGKKEEAMAALEKAKPLAQGSNVKMLEIIRFRLDNPDYLQSQEYGAMLLDTYNSLKNEQPIGFARFHLSRVEQWCKANRQYRALSEILRDFLH